MCTVHIHTRTPNTNNNTRQLYHLVNYYYLSAVNVTHIIGNLAFCIHFDNNNAISNLDLPFPPILLCVQMCVAIAIAIVSLSHSALSDVFFCFCHNVRGWDQQRSTVDLKYLRSRVPILFLSMPQ